MTPKGIPIAIVSKMPKKAIVIVRGSLAMISDAIEAEL